MLTWLDRGAIAIVVVGIVAMFALLLLDDKGHPHPCQIFEVCEGQ